MLEEVFREDWGRVLASLVGYLGDIELAEDAALLALMLTGHARTAARFRDGELVLLDDQDRAIWDQHQIDEGR